MSSKGQWMRTSGNVSIWNGARNSKPEFEGLQLRIEDNFYLRLQLRWMRMERALMKRWMWLDDEMMWTKILCDGLGSSTSSTSLSTWWKLSGSVLFCLSQSVSPLCLLRAISCGDKGLSGRGGRERGTKSKSRKSMQVRVPLNKSNPVNFSHDLHWRRKVLYLHQGIIVRQVACMV